MTDPAGYIADDGLIDAVNVALMLRQPLLLTGEPGTGKTQLAFSVAWELGLEEPLIFEVKSTSISRDLLYSFDSVRRFQAAHESGRDLDARLFIQYNALGRAILRATETEIRQRAGEEATGAGKRQSVVLIDEIDKASRDFPNDLLNELEHLYFRVPELRGLEVRADPNYRPIVIVTSNSERALPDAFLRRCVFLSHSVSERRPSRRNHPHGLAGTGSSSTGVIRELLDFFGRLRAPPRRLRKRPGTAELLNWATALMSGGIDRDKPLRSRLTWSCEH
jgi:MoxR-like ATPase